MAMTTFVNVRCHCKLNTFKVGFSTSSLPIPTGICHCNTCRHVTGQMCYQVVPIHGVPFVKTAESCEPADLGTLSQYQTSDFVTRWFCGKCSAHMFFETKTPDSVQWNVATGVLEKVEGIVKPTQHLFVGDTLDGGLADHYKSFDGVELLRYSQRSGSELLPVDWKSDAIKQQSYKIKEERLQLYCHCKKNKFYITRASACLDPSKEWWLRPGPTKDDPIKFRACQCVCTSCRLTSGMEIQSWAFLLPDNIIDPDTGSFVYFRDADKRPKSLTQYSSTPEDGVYREFCGSCGSTLFFWWIGRDVIDISVGALDQDDRGARAEGWIEWDDSVGFPEDAININMLKGLQAGLKDISK